MMYKHVFAVTENGYRAFTGKVGKNGFAFVLGSLKDLKYFKEMF